MSFMNIPVQFIGQAAGILLLLAAIPYYVDIFRGRTKPSRAAYLIWLVIGIVTLVSYVASGASATSWIFLASVINTVIIFCLSFKYGMGGLNKLDLVCISVAVIAILLWVTTKNPVTALYTSLIAGVLGYIPVIKKAYLYPNTENTLSWGIGSTSSILNLFALTSLRPAIAIAPIVIVILDVLIAGLLIFPRTRPAMKRAKLPRTTD